MIKYFSTGYLNRYLVILLLIFVIWIPELIVQETNSCSGSSSLFNISILFFNNMVWLKVANMILVLLSAFFLNRVAVIHNFVGKISTLTMLMFVLFMSVFQNQMQVNNIIIINFIIVFTFVALLDIPHNANPIPAVLNASFIIGVASLFYSPLIFLVLFVWNTVTIHRVVSWRTLVIPIIGVVLPYIFLFSWYFYSGVFTERFDILLQSLSWKFVFIFPEGIMEIGIVFIMMILITLSVVGISGHLSEKNINLRRNLLLVINYFFILVAIVVVYADSISYTLLLGLPVSLICGSWFSGVKNDKWYNIGLVIVVVLIVVNSFIPVYDNLLMRL